MPRCKICNDTDVILHAAAEGSGPEWSVESPCPACEFGRLNVKLALANYELFARCPFTNRMLFSINKICEVAAVTALRDVDWHKPEVVELVDRAHKAAHRAYLKRHRWDDLWFAVKCGLLYGALRVAVLLIWNV